MLQHHHTDNSSAGSGLKPWRRILSITTNQEAIILLFRKLNRYVGNLAPMPGIFPDYPAPVIRNTEEGEGRELAMMRWGMPCIEQRGSRASDEGSGAD